MPRATTCLLGLCRASPPLRTQPLSSYFAKPLMQCHTAAGPSLAKAPTRELVVGQSGRTYRIKATLQDKGDLHGAIHLATDGDTDVVLKKIPQDWSARRAVYDAVRSCPHVRLPVDTIVDERIMIFPYAKYNLLELIQDKSLPLNQVKYILKCALEALACMHGFGVQHNDVKPDNIMVNAEDCSTGIRVEEVFLTDLEDATILDPDQFLRGAKLGNYMWRSPEAHAEGPMRKPSDVFSFGITAIYALTKMIPFAVHTPGLTEDDKAASVYLRMLSYFGDSSGSKGFLDSLDPDNPMREVFEAVEEQYCHIPRDPFSQWDVPGLDDSFKDLVSKMTRLDPRERITAKGALLHPWFTMDR